MAARGLFPKPAETTTTGRPAKPALRADGYSFDRIMPALGGMSLG